MLWTKKPSKTGSKKGEVSLYLCIKYLHNSFFKHGWVWASQVRLDVTRCSLFTWKKVTTRLFPVQSDNTTVKPGKRESTFFAHEYHPSQFYSQFCMHHEYPSSWTCIISQQPYRFLWWMEFFLISQIIVYLLN